MGQENFTEMRKAMVVSQLRTSDVNDPRVIAAMNAVPREDFVPAFNRSVAYADRGVSVGEGRMLNAPLTTGLLVNAAEFRKTDNVLLIGAATGYTAAVIAKLAGSVVAVEQSAKLAATAKANLAELTNVTVENGAHADGFAKGAPYDVIIIDGIAACISQALVDQLDNNGRLVAPIMEGGVARLAIGRKAAGAIGYQHFSDCGGVMLPGFEQEKSFIF